MQNNLVLLILSILSIFEVSAYSNVEKGAAARARCWTSGNGRPAQWWQEGDQVTRGKYFYECRRGQLEPLGCLSSTEEKIPLGHTFQQDRYEFICQLGSDGYIEFGYSACVGTDGRTYQKGETWTDAKNTYYYRCRDDGRVVKTTIEGCIAHDKQRRVPLGQTDDFNGYTYKCQQKTTGVVQMCSVGCIHEGTRYTVGQQYRDGDYLFYCKLQGGKCTKQCIGCVAGGQDLYDGQRYKRDGTTYQCEIRPGKRSHRAVGCSIVENGRDINKVIGCRWYEQNPDWKIEKTCETDGDNKTKVTTVGCIYKYKGFDRIFLEPGKYTIWNLPKQKDSSVGLACRKTADGAELVIFDVAQLERNTSGLKYDLPRGK
ncbi:uncharacterized protein CELE_F42A8.1 [Caenorhabditis elegans]|uniref:Uncharacterized protein F42A8.1 n=1 Tax=Caenorhabditis elegans TaxID=6239 RepID=YR51_CAEEL|nr:Uncharacterized protein CELE_F42A8.1 [Caenorhabditis elegans]Q09321.1 RecName: Full=Uncharacterized protein F42A8.1 [Caenorhabditis elegans]CAA87779.1 Uncharacterized protein CELE_F42A8.1 [Caenorhabditis elegans]|eukprot:NP_495991.1 Uncharacterized protein CELE_F42A8.1 [Caenorhabditis elegans]